MSLSFVQAAKQALVAATGLSKDALHIHVGLLAFLGAALLFRRPLKSILPWAAALSVALLGELVDAVDDIQSSGEWHWAASGHDIINTMAWPTLILLLARLTRLFGHRVNP